MSLFAIQLSYGGPDALKHFVNEAHKRDIAVIFDFVPNHLAFRNVLQWFDGSNLYFAEGAVRRLAPSCCLGFVVDLPYCLLAVIGIRFYARCLPAEPTIIACLLACRVH